MRRDQKCPNQYNSELYSPSVNLIWFGMQSQRSAFQSTEIKSGKCNDTKESGNIYLVLAGMPEVSWHTSSDFGITIFRVVKTAVRRVRE